jgi:hypothetical protein
MEEFLNEVRAHSFFPPKFPSIQMSPKSIVAHTKDVKRKI